MLIKVPVTGAGAGAGVAASVSVEYQPQDPTWPYGALGTMQSRVQGLSDFTGSATKQRQPSSVVRAAASTLTCLGTET